MPRWLPFLPRLADDGHKSYEEEDICQGGTTGQGVVQQFTACALIIELRMVHDGQCCRIHILAGR